MSGKRKWPEVPLTDFITAWTEIEKVGDIAAMFDIPKRIVISRAVALRRAGVDLAKKGAGGRRVGTKNRPKVAPVHPVVKAQQAITTWMKKGCPTPNPVVNPEWAPKNEVLLAKPIPILPAPLVTTLKTLTPCKSCTKDRSSGHCNCMWQGIYLPDQFQGKSLSSLHTELASFQSKYQSGNLGTVSSAVVEELKKLVDRFEPNKEIK